MSYPTFEERDPWPPIPIKIHGDEPHEDLEDQHGGPIETSLLVVSVDATDAMKAVADYVCDDTSDEEEIEAARVAQQAVAGTGRIQLGEGTFTCTSQIDMGTIELAGAGVNETTIEFWDGTYPAGAAIYAPYGVKDLTVKVLTNAASTPYFAIETGQYGTVENVNVVFAPTDPSSLSVSAVRVTDGRIVGCDIENVIADAYGIELISSGYRRPLLVSQCYVDCADTGAAGIWVAGDYCNVVDNVVIDAVGNGIHLHSTANRALVVGNRVDGSSVHGIYVDSNPGESIISANVVNDSGTDGIHITATSTNDVVGPNQIDNSGGVDINDNGTGTIYVPARTVDVSPLTTKGDLWGYTTVDARRTVGSDGDHLVADSGDATGVSWETPNVAAFGECYVTTPAATTTAVADTPVKAAGTTTLSTTPTAVDFTMPANNRLTYGGTVTKNFKVTATITATCAGNIKLLGFWIAKGGTVITASHIDRHVGTGADEGAVAVQALVSLATNEYVEVWCCVEDGTDDMTLEHMSLMVTEA